MTNSKYYVVFEVFASIRVVVEAKNDEEAEKKAIKKVRVSLCHRCARHLSIDGLGMVLEVAKNEG